MVCFADGNELFSFGHNYRFQNMRTIYDCKAIWGMGQMGEE